MSRQEDFKKLRTILSNLYPLESSSRRVAQDAGLNIHRIAFSSMAIDNWNSVLREAQNTNKMEDVFQVVLEDYGANFELLAAIEAYRRADKSQPSSLPLHDLPSLFAQAVALEIQGELGKALATYKIIESIDPRYPGLSIAVGRIESVLKKPYVDINGRAEPGRLVPEASPLSLVPVIQSVTLSTDTVNGGGSVIVTVKARSNAPVNWINRSLEAPTENIYGGGHEVTFTETEDGLWVHQWTYTVSKWQPSGTYTYRRISVRNEGRRTSDIWPNISFTVNNVAQAETPIIQSVILSTDTVNGGGSVIVTVKARSNAPVNWINRSLYSPDRDNIYGGGRSATFSKVEDNVWVYQWTETISKWQPSGTYTYRRISVRNEGRRTSDIWPDISFIVNNHGT